MNFKELADQAGLDWHMGWTLDEDAPNRFAVLVELAAQQTRARCIKLVLAGSLQRDRKRIAALIEEDGK